MYRQPQLFFPVHIYTMSNRVDTNAPLKSSSNYLSATTVQVPDSTSVKYSQQSSEQFATSPPPLAGSLYPKLDAEMRQAFIGPISVEKFLDDFLPVEDVPNPSTSLGLYGVGASNHGKADVWDLCMYFRCPQVFLTFLRYTV